MKTQVTFRHQKSDPVLNDAALEAAKKFEKFYDGITSYKVEFSEEGINKIVDIEIHVNGATIVGKEESDEFIKSFNAAEDKIIRQLKKKKTKESHT